MVGVCWCRCTSAYVWGVSPKVETCCCVPVCDYIICVCFVQAYHVCMCITVCQFHCPVYWAWLKWSFAIYLPPSDERCWTFRSNSTINSCGPGCIGAIIGAILGALLLAGIITAIIVGCLLCNPRTWFKHKGVFTSGDQQVRYSKYMGSYPQKGI